MSDATALVAEEIVVRFGGVRAVAGVDLSVEVGDFLGLLGPNGSGKTTLLNALCGVVPAAGRLTVDGHNVRLGHPGAARRAGLMRVFQAPQVYTDLTCMENVLLSSTDHAFTGLSAAALGRRWMMRHERERWAAAHETLEQVGLTVNANQLASVLTYGQRRLLDLARALYGKPRVLLLDEPSAGFNDAETSELATLLQNLDRTDMAVVLVEHKIDFIDRLCTRVAVLELGYKIADGTPTDVWSDQRVIDAYLGVAADA